MKIESLTAEQETSISRCRFPPAASMTLPRTKFRSKIQATGLLHPAIDHCAPCQKPMPNELGWARAGGLAMD
jgi:hypothetical protein